MVQTTAGSGGVLQVDTGTLRASGARLTELSESVQALSARVSSASSAAASACPGWQISAASSAAGSRWAHGVTAQASAVARAGAKLARSAANYSDVESGLVRLIAATGLRGAPR